jgi:hypothetical protein
MLRALTVSRIELDTRQPPRPPSCDQDIRLPVRHYVVYVLPLLSVRSRSDQELFSQMSERGDV